jgi:Lrp/AsnC family transcriptional regulator, regulator for asnA, asnC and gidA
MSLSAGLADIARRRASLGAGPSRHPFDRRAQYVRAPETIDTATARSLEGDDPVAGAVPTLDDLDARLVALLKEDARASFVDLAGELGTSEGTVRARLKRLVETGVIRQFTVRTTGHAVKALVAVRLAPHTKTAKVSERIRGLEGVTDVWEVSGDVDVLARVDVATTEELDRVVEGIRGMEEVESTDSRLILREL